MKKINRSILIAALGFATISAFGQPPGGPPPSDNTSGPRPPREARGPLDAPPPHRGRGLEEGPGPMPPLFALLDTNHDGVIDAEEIVNAPMVLSRLAKHTGGKLTLRDFGRPPMRGEMGNGGGPGPGPRGDRDGERGPDRFGPLPGGRDRNLDGRPGPRPPMREDRDDQRGPDRFGPPPGGDDRNQDGRPGQRPPMREDRDGERGPDRFGPPPGGPDRNFDGRPGPRSPMREGGDFGPDRRGPRPEDRATNSEGRPEPRPGVREDGDRQPERAGVRPPRPEGPGPNAQDDERGQDDGPAPAPPRD